MAKEGMVKRNPSGQGDSPSFPHPLLLIHHATNCQGQPPTYRLPFGQPYGDHYSGRKPRLHYEFPGDQSLSIKSEGTCWFSFSGLVIDRSWQIAHRMLRGKVQMGPSNRPTPAGSMTGFLIARLIIRFGVGVFGPRRSLTRIRSTSTTTFFGICCIWLSLIHLPRRCGQRL